MNRVYYGKIGGGKTFAVIFQELLPALRAGRKVITNIDGLNIREIRNYIGKEIDLEVRMSRRWWRESLSCELQDDGHEGRAVLNSALFENALYIIDEAQMIWDAREFKDTKSGFLHLLEYNRHFGIDIVFVTQNVKRCDVNISRLANDSYQIKNLGFVNFFLKNRFAVNRRQTPFDKDVIAQYTRSYDPVIFSLYRSGVDANAVKQKGRYSSPVVFAFIIFFAVAVGVLINQGNPIASITKSVTQKKEGVNNNGGNSNNIFGLPPITYNQVPAQTGNKSYKSSSPEDKKPVIPLPAWQDQAELEASCINAGFVRNTETELIYYECPNASVIVRNGKTDRVFKKSASSMPEPLKINPVVSGALSNPPASPALAGGGREDAPKGLTGDLVNNANKSNTFKKNE